ncbi:hypothetical protein G9A89_011145 [Geosiphon pyriformis]|nr:hypothetical protein G9A89_011145 [Geosiphon pyriformis]
MINLPLAPPNAQQQQQPQPLSQQQIQQQPQPNLDPMVYTPIAKLEKFTSKEDNAQVWLNDIEKAIAANGWNDIRAIQVIPYFLQNTANLWYQSLVNKLQDFNAFKIEFLRYFSNNNSINRLANTFTTIKQEENKAVITYLGYFHRNLHQIQVINTNYFTVAQILNQFIRGLCSSILQRIHPLHLIDLQAAITNTRDFEATEHKANYAQTINLIMNRLSELNSKLKQFSDSINQKLEGYLTDNHNKSLGAIFLFKLEEPSATLLFSEATLKEKPITTMYTDVKVDGYFIKLILNSRSAGSIITKQLMNQLGCRVDHAASTRIITANRVTKTPIGEIDDFLIEINSITVPIKNGQHTHVPATCGHFKTTNIPAPLIDFEEEKSKPTWKAYQLPPILSWDNNVKRKQRKEPT